MEEGQKVERRHYLFAGTSGFVDRDTRLFTIRRLVLFFLSSVSSSPEHVFADFPNLIDLYNRVE